MYDIVINAVSENEFCPYYPRKCKILCPIGNYPLLYFIMKYIIELSDKDDIYLLLHKSQVEDVENELDRWELKHPSLQIIPLNNQAPITTDLILSVFQKDIFYMESHFPFLNETLLDKFLKDSKKDKLTLFTGNFTDKKFNAIKKKLLLVSETLRFLDMCYVPCSIRNDVISNMVWRDFLHSQTNIHLLEIPKYYLKFEFFPLLNSSDRVYLDNLFWKRFNTDFLLQFHSIWKQLNNIDERLKKLENS